MKTSCLLAAIAVALPAFATDYVVKGEIEGLDGKTMYMRDYDNNNRIDSAVVTGGSFIFQGSYPSSAYVRIENGHDYANCVLDTLAVVDFKTHLPAAGSALNMGLKNFHDSIGAYDEEMLTFRKELKSKGVNDAEMRELQGKLFRKIRPKLLGICTNTIKRNDNGLGYAAILEYTRMSLTPEEWDEAYDMMPAGIKSTGFVNLMNTQYSAMRNSMPGKQFIDIKGKTVDGQAARLSDYAGKGKYLIVDFWASWCAPCRQEAKETLKPLYEQYKDDDRFMIVGVAVGDNPDKTIEAIEKSGYHWTHIIDAGRKPMELYGFNGIPMIMIIGPDGTILERNIRGGNLRSKIDSYLK